ncbi:MAG: DEAD/DEAH box helicase [Candidatus Bathyarchaeota archaeon]|nr:DEAD/DEAH box helicase [Candidatus Bathyarchaeota archaeon]
MRIEELSDFGLSQTIIDRLSHIGFESLTKAQEEAVHLGLFDGKNLLVSAPTNTGKTFIGELAALNASKKQDRKSFFLVPLRALAEQMYKDFEDKYADWGLKTAISTSDHYEFDNELLSFDVIIATYEKLNSLIMKRPKILDNIGLVVIDEIQHIGDNARGLSLEMLLTRLILFTNDIQIIGLSATITNADVFAKWLNCQLINIQERDVELREGILYTGTNPVKFRGHSLNNRDFLYREFNSGKIGVEKGLMMQTYDEIVQTSKTEQCLVFVNTQGKAEELAEGLAREMPRFPQLEHELEELDELLEATPTTAKLKKVVPHGVSFHHSGLLADERRFVEKEFKNGGIRIICSTPTLSAGVNTPAKNVVILFIRYYNGQPLSVSSYKNISGRAGRLRGLDQIGRSALLASDERNLEYLWDNYVNTKPERITSQIAKSDGLDCSLLQLISSATCSNIDELAFCLQNTLFGFQFATDRPATYEREIAEMIMKELTVLKNGGLVNENGKLEATEIGLRCAEELLTPKAVILLYTILQASETKFSKGNYESITEGIIHLCCCTDVAERVYPPKSQAETQELQAIWTMHNDVFIHKPAISIFLTSLRTTRMLLRWIEGAQYVELSQYAPPGTINKVASNIQWILHGLAHLAERPLFNFDDDFVNFLYDLSERICFGVPKEALPIIRLRIQGIHRRRAMNLVKAGFVNIDSILGAAVEELAKVPNIGNALALRIKEAVETYIKNEAERKKSIQIRLTKKMGKETGVILGLYDTHGDDLARHLSQIFVAEFGLNSQFIGDKDQHGPDVLVTVPDGLIAVEVKRKERGRVSAIEAEEILGKGAKYSPIISMTIGYPDFVEVAKANAISSKVTMISAPIIGDMVVQFWQGKLTTDKIIELFKSNKALHGITPDDL